MSEQEYQAAASAVREVTEEQEAEAREWYARSGWGAPSIADMAGRADDGYLPALAALLIWQGAIGSVDRAERAERAECGCDVCEATR